MERIEYCLDGDWRLVLDPEDKGKDEQWFLGEALSDALDVKVPSVWDRWIPDYDGVGWYFREFELGAEWEGRHVALEFEAVDYYAETWLNGVRLGDHEGGYTSFSLDAAAAAQTGLNRLAVRVIDPHGPDGFGDFKPKQIPSAKENGYWSFAGIWGGVRLVGKHPAHITDVFVRPDIRRKRITATVTASQPGAVGLRIAGTAFETSGPPGDLSVDFPEFELWSPESPRLYTLDCELCVDGEAVDCVSVRFGMREFNVREKCFFLNNRPIHVKAVLHQPDYARSLAAPETAALARKELELAKQAGFNMVRLHIKTAPGITLDLADKLGIMLYEEPPIGWIEDSPWMEERCRREVCEMIRRDRNHPSIVLWGMLNESGNIGHAYGTGAQRIRDDLCRLARSLDPTRLVLGDSGGTNITREPAYLMRPYHDELEPCDDLHIYLRAPVDREIEQYFGHCGDPDVLSFLSEFGFGGMENLADVIAQYGADKTKLKDARFLQLVLDAVCRGFAERGLDRVFGDFAGFAAAACQLQCDAARHQIDALRANPKLAGYCYTQLCDAGHEWCAGTLDRWRRPKPVWSILKKVQQPLRPLIQVPRTNLVPRQEIPVTVTLANDERIEGRADLSLQVVGPTNQVLWKKKRNIKLPRPGKELWQGVVSASGSPGTHKFVVRLIQNMEVIGENAVELHVFTPASPCGIDVHVLDPQNVGTARCAVLAKPAGPNAPIHIVPPLANTVRAYPDNDLVQVLAQVKEGAVALVFAPPEDWNDLADTLDPALRATSKDAVGAFLGVFHYAKFHPVFDGLPARGLMGQPYRNVVAPRTFIEPSDEDICGSFDAAPAAAGNYALDETTWWGADILVRRYGAGRVVFTHMAVLEHLGEDPVADRLFVNLLSHFVRRSVPSSGIVPLDQKTVEWLRDERTDKVRRWMVVGMFPNWGETGHDTPYPPEKKLDFNATYTGWYKTIAWRSWHSRVQDDHLVDLQEALSPVYEYYPRFDHGTAYAYAEFACDKRHTATIQFGVCDTAKLWLNGTLVHESKGRPKPGELDRHEIPASLKQGRNTLLVKVSKIPGRFQFSLNMESAEGGPLSLKWWR